MKNNSAKNKLSRSHLETLTSSQLIELADEYGIDIPDDLNRRFIIVELLEVAKEIDENLNYKETIKETDEAANLVTELPEGYNETKIDILLRNPVSIFVYWDFSETLYKQLHDAFGDIRSKMNLAIAYSHKGSYYEQNEQLPQTVTTKKVTFYVTYTTSFISKNDVVLRARHVIQK